MKALLLTILFTLALWGTKIEFPHQLTAEVSPDQMVTTLRITAEHQQDQPLKSGFDRLVRAMKQKQTACSGGGYRISPRYDYKLQPPKFVGYRGEMNFECRFDKVEDFDNSLALLRRQMDPKLFRLSQNPLRWTVSQSLYQSTLEKLKTESLVYAKQYNAELHHHFSRCTIEAIAMNNPNHNPPIMRAEAAYSAALKNAPQSNEVPIAEPETITLEALLVYHCEL